MIRISTTAADVDIDWLHAALSERAYWAIGRPRELVERAVANSLNVSAFEGDRQVGFARVVTDFATFAWICDVFVDESVRGQGIGKRLLAAITSDPRLAGLKRTLLATSTPAFYEPFGFRLLEQPDRWMIRCGEGQKGDAAG